MCSPGIVSAQCTCSIMCVSVCVLFSFFFFFHFMTAFSKLYSDRYRWRKLVNLINRQSGGGGGGGGVWGEQIPQTLRQQQQRLHLSIKLAGAQSVSKHNFARGANTQQFAGAQLRIQAFRRIDRLSGRP